MRPRDNDLDLALIAGKIDRHVWQVLKHQKAEEARSDALAKLRALSCPRGYLVP